MKRTSPAASGIVYAVLSVIGIVILVWAEIDTETDEGIISHYADSGTRTWEIVGFFLVAVGALFFLWFLSTLRVRLRAAEPEPGANSNLVFGAGVTAATLLVGAAAALASTSMAIEASSSFEVDTNLARLTATIGFLMMTGSALANLVVIIATSATALRAEVLPRWLGWVGFGAAILAVAETVLLPVFVIPLWVIVVSIVMMRQTSTSHPEVREPALV